MTPTYFRTRIRCMMVLCCSLASVQAQARRLPASTSVVSAVKDPEQISLYAGESKLIDCTSPIRRMAVGLSNVAAATVISPSEVLVSGKTTGQTNLILWRTDGVRKFFTITVRPSPYQKLDALDAMRREIKQDLPDQQILLDEANGVLFLRGTAKDLNSSERAYAIVSAIAASKVVNLLNVEVPGAEPQILLKVMFASVDRSRSDQLGINLFNLGAGNSIISTSTGQFSPPALTLPAPGVPSSAGISTGLNILAFLPGQNIGATIQALESKGLVQVLSEPNILAQNGKQGSFLAGGEYPYPVPQGSGNAGTTITIDFKEYGIRLNFIPTVTPRGTILLQVAPEVSSLDFSSGVQISGFQVPAIDVRKMNTELELGDGQSFVISGLLDNRETETFQKIPFLADIPVLGKFFQSVSKNKTNTELIVIVTPTIVSPITKGEASPQLNFPAPFLAPNSKVPMHTPDNSTQGDPNSRTHNAIPVEQLIRSMQREKPLVIDSASSGVSGGGSSAGP
jgi:pilus assembly protein CpaC